MPLNSQIPLMTHGVDASGAISAGANQANQLMRFAEEKKQAPIRNRLLDLQVGNAEGVSRQQQGREAVLDAVPINASLQRKDNAGALALIDQRIQKLTSQGRDPSDSIAFRERLINNPDQAALEIADIISMGQQTGILKAPQNQGFTLGQGQQRYDAAGNLIASGADKDPQGFTLGEGQQRFNANNTLVASGGAKTPTNQKTTDIKNFDFAKEQGFEGSFNDFMKQGKGASKAEEEELKATVKANVERLSDLKKTKKTRDSSVVKARRFLRAFESGDAESGTTRTVAGFLPGVFTDQAQFDQELDAFAEVAAREKLKAVGEIRPTDADVEGMKRALFGVGRDEKVNIQLLREFISEQENQNDELEDLIEAKKRGSLSTFTGGRGPNNNLKELSDEELLNF